MFPEYFIILFNVLFIACADPNEMYITSIFSEPTCGDRIPRSIEPVSKCQCKGGYLRENGKCILPDDCRKYKFSMKNIFQKCHRTDKNIELKLQL